MRPTVLTSSLLRSMMGLSLLVRGNVCACRLGSSTRCRPSYRSSWLGGLMLVRLKSSSWKSVALGVGKKQKGRKKKWVRIVRQNQDKLIVCLKWDSGSAESKMADQNSTTHAYSLSLDAAGDGENYTTAMLVFYSLIGQTVQRLTVSKSFSISLQPLWIVVPIPANFRSTLGLKKVCNCSYGEPFFKKPLFCIFWKASPLSVLCNIQRGSFFSSGWMDLWFLGNTLHLFVFVLRQKKKDKVKVCYSCYNASENLFCGISTPMLRDLKDYCLTVSEGALLWDETPIGKTKNSRWHWRCVLIYNGVTFAILYYIEISEFLLCFISWNFLGKILGILVHSRVICVDVDVV